MASEIRVNTINNRSGLGTITISDTGAVFAGVTTITSLQVTGTLIGVANTDNIRTNTNATFLQNVNVSGAVTSTGMIVTGVTTVAAGSTSVPSISPSGDTNTGIFFPSADTIAFGEGGAESARIDSSGRLGIGTASPVQTLDVNGGIGVNGAITCKSSGTARGYLGDVDGDTHMQIRSESGQISFKKANTEFARFDTSSRFLVGTSSYSGNSKLVVNNAVSGGSEIAVFRNEINPNYGGLVISGGITDRECRLQAAYGNSFLTFYTEPSVGSAAERMRIGNDGNVYIGRTSTDDTVQGTSYNAARWNITTTNDVSLLINRQSSDGDLVVFRQANTQEGSISVSGTTVQLNGAHLSRWSQLPGGAPRTEILRGSVLSNLDEMCEWGDEDNEQLNRTKVSDIEGDKNVAGVFVAWDDDDDTYINDFYCAMTGDFIIRIAEGVTVERGDLLMSAGDGTAKPQDDDIIRSKTIAKVTSTHVTCTYDDGSYCVPCVLMAC